MTIEKLHSGIKITDIVDGQFIHQNYIGYSMAEAKRLFRQYVKTFKERG